jgi:hypothetical protein
MVTGADFSGGAIWADGTIALTIRGTADYAALDGLEMLLSRAHAEAHRRSATAMTVDLRELEFMNSSCMRSVLSWISDIQDLPSEARYRVTFRSDPKRHWQKRSLHTIRSFAVDLITVTEQ